MTSPADSEVEPGTEDLAEAPAKPDTDAKSDTEPDTEPDTDATSDAEPPPAARRTLPAVVLVASVALLVAALAVAGWFGAAWIRLANDDGLEYSAAREEVDRVARSAIATMNQLDYRTVDEGLASWADVTTGELHQEIADLDEDDRKQLAEARSVSTAEVLSLAVRELDERSGTAIVIAAVKLTVTVDGGESADKYLRMEAELLRTADGWKLRAIGKVPYAQPVQSPK